MSSIRHGSDVLVIGGGPAGIAAACAAAGNRQHVLMVDDNPAPGGQIWRGEGRRPSSPEAAAWLKKLQGANVEFIHGARVFHQPEALLLLAETPDGVQELRYSKLILATGARERFVPFPGWTRPEVMGAGGLQALVKSGMPISGKRVVIAGSGPLLMAVAAYLDRVGARVLLIAEQASRKKVLGFSLTLFKQPGKVRQAIGLKLNLRRVPYLTDCWPVAARRDEQSFSVTLRRGTRTWSVACDYLACGFHLVANTELAALLECELEGGCVRVNDYHETSIPDVYCVGESTGIGGLELSLVEGQIAGLAATGDRDKARKYFPSRERLRRFARSLNRAFALREELKMLASPDTIVCRCEDVTFAQLKGHDSWRMAKLQSRCGMGPCQGRVCGPAVEFLFGWKAESVRPPIFPVRLGSLAQISQSASGQDPTYP